ncbi:hypothetical protein FF1_043669 [Malus domestica]
MVAALLWRQLWVGGFFCSSCPSMDGFWTCVSVMALSNVVDMAKMSSKLEDFGLNTRLWVLGLRISRSPQQSIKRRLVV